MNKIKKISKEIFHFIKHEVFSKEYFLFTLNLTARKISIYACAIIYFVVLLAYVTVAPLITNEQPTYFFTLPVTSLIMILLLAIISSYISLEIFRTPIDDGTELLIISKPLHRSQIFFVKSLVLFIFAFTTGAIASVLSCFSFTISFADYEQTSYGVAGIFVCTIVCFAVFGGISIFLSMFCKKVVSLLITTGLTFILVFASLLCSLVIDKNGNNPNPAEVSYKNNIARVSYTNINNQGKPNVTQGLYLVAKDSKDFFDEELNKTYETPEKIYTNYFNTLVFPKYAYGDFAGQLGSMFMLNSGSKDIFSSLTSQSLMSSSYKLKFSPVTNFNTNLSNLLNLEINLPNIDSVNFDINFKFLYVNRYSASIGPSAGSRTDYSASYKYTYYSYSQQTLSNEKYLDYLSSLDDILFQKDFSQYVFKKIEVTDTDVQKAVKISDNLSLFFRIINEITRDSLTQYFLNIPNNQLSRIEAIKELDRIIYTGIYRNFIGSNKTDFNLKNLIAIMSDWSSEDKYFWNDYFSQYSLPLIKFVLLRLLNVNLETFFFQLSWQIASSAKDPNWKVSEQSIKTIIINSILNSGIFNGFSVPLNIQNDPYSFNSGYLLSPSNYFINFQKVNFISLYNPILLVFSWLIFSLIIVLISLVIYRKKDFK